MEKRTIFLIVGVLLSIAIHISPLLFLDNAKYSFYDTDTWYTVRQIQLLNSNQPTGFDPMLVPPDGRAIQWSDFTARVGTLFTDSTEQLQIFNHAAITPIILLLILCTLGFVLTYILYGKQTAIMAFALLSIPTGGLCYQAMYGVIDHHLLECILGIGMVLSWYDYGHWILEATNKSPLSDPFQDNAELTSEIFTSNKSRALALIHHYNISYVLISSKDSDKYTAMQYYFNGGDYDRSMLKELIDGKNMSEFHSGTISIFNTTSLGLL